MQPPKRLTHFLCIPLLTPTSTPQLSVSLAAFRTDPKATQSSDNPKGIPEKAIRPLGTLHLTLGVMSLLTKERVDGALALLKSLDIPSLLAAAAAAASPPLSRAAQSKGTESKEKEDAKLTTLRVTLQGLKSMHDPTSTSIMYAAPVDPSGQLQTFAEALRDVFTASEFLIAESRPLLLHATIVNTVYVPGVRGVGRGQGKRKGKLTLDVRDVLERYKGCEWMRDVRLEKLAICRMGAKKEVDGEGRETGEEAYVVEGERDL
jgi:activating signal cointegrator complex subunit 1